MLRETDIQTHTHPNSDKNPHRYTKTHTPTNTHGHYLDLCRSLTQGCDVVRAQKPTLYTTIEVRETDPEEEVISLKPELMIFRISVLIFKRTNFLTLCLRENKKIFTRINIRAPVTKVKKKVLIFPQYRANKRFCTKIYPREKLVRIKQQV